ncbi:MAG: ABC transporter ATP-binding protein [Armatimonadota bacterium]|nr:MAG: ABC transporter ATP-binding protein [Armatimonadota bacterium]
MEAKNGEIVCELRHVDKIYLGAVPTPALLDINLQVRRGEFLVVLGASGSGKTTLLNVIGLLDTPTSGQVWLAGRNAAELSEEERAALRSRYMGFVFQFHYLLPEFTVMENALLPCQIVSKAMVEQNRERVKDLLERVGLGDRLKYRPSQLSGGQQQRVAIVRALANNPELVLADEPTGNLDSKNGFAVFEMMRFMNRQTGTAFVVVTHDERLAQEADRVVVLEDGRIVKDETLPLAKTHEL